MYNLPRDPLLFELSSHKTLMSSCEGQSWFENWEYDTLPVTYYCPWGFSPYIRALGKYMELFPMLAQGRVHSTVERPEAHGDGEEITGFPGRAPVARGRKVAKCSGQKC